MKQMHFLTFLLTLVLLASCPLTASAQKDDGKGRKENATEKAKEHFKSGQALFGAGQFEKAAESFLKAYEYKPLAAFLFNIAVCYEKLEKYAEAKQYFVDFLAKDPQTKELASIQARIRLLDRLIEYKESLKKPVDKPGDKPADKPADKPGDKPADKPGDKPGDKPADKPGDKPGDKPADKPGDKPADKPGDKPVDKPADKPGDKPVDKPGDKPADKPALPLVKPELPPIATRTLTAVSTDPPGAVLYLNDKKEKLGTSPFEGEIPLGKHVLIVEMKGFADIKREINVQENRMLDIMVSLKKDVNMAWVQITSNVPGAQVFVDNKEIGAVGHTPFNGVLKPGKHTVYVEQDGYREEKRELEVSAGDTNALHVKLERMPIGYLTILGRNVRDARVKLGSRTICVAPCSKVKIPVGEHRLRIVKKGRKTVEQKVEVVAGEQKTYEVTLNRAPDRTGAISGYVLGLATLGAGIWAGGKSVKLRDDYQADLDAGIPVFSNDSRLQDGKIYSIAANVLYGVSALSFAVALYRTFIDTSPDSRIRLQTVPEGSSVTWEPLMLPGGAGLGLTIHY